MSDPVPAHVARGGAGPSVAALRAPANPTSCKCTLQELPNGEVVPKPDLRRTQGPHALGFRVWGLGFRV